MITLYKNSDRVLCYWEIRDNDDTSVIIRSGPVGDKGIEEIKPNVTPEQKKEIQQATDQKINDGYYELDMEDYMLLVLEYRVAENQLDVEKRGRLEEVLNNLLQTTGLGICDGGGMGSGIMEICCLVVDFEKAKLLIEEELKNTEFSDYTRIYHDKDYDEDVEF